MICQILKSLGSIEKAKVQTLLMTKSYIYYINVTNKRGNVFINIPFFFIKYVCDL